MGMDFNIKPAGVPAALSFGQPVAGTVRDAVATQLPASQTVSAAEASVRVRNDSSGPSPGLSHQTIFDRDAAAMVYQVVDNRSSMVVRQFPDEAMLRRRAYLRAMDMLKSDHLRDPVADRKA